MVSETTVGREPVQIVEIVQPFCANTYGVAPCTAAGSTGSECFNTYLTCQDQANFSLSSLSLWFSSGKVAEAEISGAPYIIPSLLSVSTSPTMINVASANDNAQGLGNRAVCTITLLDHPHSDRRVDPYVSTRGYDPMTKASFWTKWLYRNRYRQNAKIIVYEGYVGQALSAMSKRTYFLQTISPPNADGQITITGKDIITRLEERKAQAPLASPGTLYSAISAAVTSFEVAGAVTADYSASGTLRIGNEVMTYTSQTTSANGVTFSGVTRGTDGTTAETHAVDDAVQECLRYTDARIDDVVADLLTTYGGIDAAYLDTVQWATEFDDYLSFWLLNALITVPTGVTDLVSEIMEQSLVYFWWDERTSLISMKAVRGVDAQPDTLTEENHIIAGSFSMEEHPDQRTSQVWVYYRQDDYTKDHNDPNAYVSLKVIADLTSEGDNKYGEPSIRKVFARWLNSGALAGTTASKIITRYVDIPTTCTFRMDAKDRSYGVGDTVYISHHLDVDELGDRRIRQWLITSYEEVVPGEVVEYTATDTTLYGRIYYVMASGAANYPGAATAPFKQAYIGDASGLLSDGGPAARIA